LDWNGCLVVAVVVVVVVVCLFVLLAADFERINASSYAINKSAIVAPNVAQAGTGLAAMFAHNCKMASGIRYSIQTPTNSQQQQHFRLYSSFPHQFCAVVVVACLLQFRLTNFSQFLCSSCCWAPASVVTSLLNCNFRLHPPTTLPLPPIDLPGQLAYLALV